MDWITRASPLDDVELAGVAVQRPLDVHRLAVVVFDGHGLPGQFDGLLVADAESEFPRVLDVARLHAAPGPVVVDHLDGLGPAIAPQYRVVPGGQGGFVQVELVGIDRALHHCFPQPIGRGDEHGVAESGFRVQREHDAGGAEV
jgi:hypothetical protein